MILLVFFFNNNNFNNSILLTKEYNNNFINNHLQKDLSQNIELSLNFSNNHHKNKKTFTNITIDNPSESLLNFDELLYFINSSNKRKNIKEIKSSKNSKKIKFFCEECKKDYKRKEYLSKHLFFKHSNFKGIICPYCSKNIKYFHEHIKLCKLKHEINSINKKKSCEIIQENYLDKITTFKLLKNTIILPKFNHTKIKLFPKNEKIVNFEFFNYYEENIIDKGGNMIVFYGKTKLTKEDVAVKIDLKKKNKSDIINEIEILTRLKGIPQIPLFYFYEFNSDKNIVVESLFGPSLMKFYKYNKKIFEPILVSIIGIQIIEILSNMHKRGIIHNDLKPHNICWGQFKNSRYEDYDKFFLVDFGYSRKIFEPLETTNKELKGNNKIFIHYDNKLENKFSGTADFMAIAISEGFRPNRATDIEELIYTLIYLLKKQLPWEKIKSKNHLDKCKKICEIKKNIELAELFRDIPNELMYIYKNTIKLNYDEEPDYNLFIILFNNILARFGISNKENQKYFLQRNIDKLLSINDLKNKNASERSILAVLFDGYPLNYSI